MRALPLLFLAFVSAFAHAADIRWEPFELPAGATGVQAQLGRLTVPLDRTRPDGGSAEIAFVRLQGAKASTRPPIVYLAGGPGDSGVNSARNPYAIAALAKWAESGDVILLDQRGVGLSTPRPVCAPKPIEPHERFLPFAAAIARTIESTRACVAEWAAKGVDAAAFNNRESAADVDDLRKALGVPKISLVSFSYGTYLALATLRTYGPNIERVVLIGPSGPNHMRKLPLTLDTQLAKLSLLAASDPSIGTEVPDMSALLRRVLAKLEKEPMTVTITDRARKQDVQIPITADTLRQFLVADIGDGNDFPVFPALLLTIERGDPSILAWFAEKRYNQRGGVNLMYLGMRCSAGATPSRDRDIALEVPRSLFANSMNAGFPEICTGLPVRDMGDAFRGPLVTDVPVLFVSGTLDSNCPPYQSEEIRWGMTRGTHLIVANAGHEDLEPNGDVQAVISDFLAGKDVGERRVALPVPDFKSVEEAKKERKR